MTEPKFNLGDRVRHITGTQEMAVVKNLTKSVESSYNDLDNQYTYVDVYNGRVKCSWTDQNGQPQSAIFSEEELVLVS